MTIPDDFNLYSTRLHDDEDESSRKRVKCILSIVGIGVIAAVAAAVTLVLGIVLSTQDG